MIHHWVIVREQTGDGGTAGHLFVGSMLSLRTLELPWRGNLPDISCIPCGAYRLRLVKSLTKWTKTYGWCLSFDGVPGRELVEIHYGNFAGDTTKGWKSSSTGCVLVGMHYVESFGDDEQPGVTDSVIAMVKLLGVVGGDELELQIVSAFAERFAI